MYIPHWFTDMNLPKVVESEQPRDEIDVLRELVMAQALQLTDLKVVVAELQQQVKDLTSTLVTLERSKVVVAGAGNVVVRVPPKSVVQQQYYGMGM